jgi:hypothetical protein
MKIKQHTQTNMLGKTRDRYLMIDREVTVDTDKETKAVTVEVTLFNDMADRFFDRLKEEERIQWVNEFFNGENAPMIADYKLVCHGH